MSTEQHSIGKSLALHLLPGALIVLLFVAVAPALMRAGFPPLFAMTVVGMTVGLGFQIWHLYNEGKKRNGRLSLQGIVLFQEPLPVRQYLAWGILFVIAAFLINGAAQPIGVALLKLLPWLPEWFEMRDAGALMAYPKSALTITFILYLLINGIAAPIIEEMYFRGYLMPRLSRFGKWTPVIETLLFTLYHFWQPYYWITIFFSILPVVYAVWWKKNIKLGIFVHMALNLIGGMLLTAQVLGQL
jgi:hypothetical protein